MTPTPRHKQKPIAIRSNLAAGLLKEMTRDGRSQAQVIEDALKKAVAERPQLSLEERNARIDAIVLPLHKLAGRTRLEIEAEIFDENGLPR